MYRKIEHQWLHGDKRQNLHNTEIDNIIYENNITKLVFVLSNIHMKTNNHISSELSSFKLQAVIGEVKI